MSGTLVLGSKKGDNTLVDLDAGNDVPLLEELDERSAVSSLLVNSFVEKDDTAYVTGFFRGQRKKQLSVPEYKKLKVI